MTELNRGPESRRLIPPGMVQSQIEKILAEDAARASGSPGLVDYFYENLFERLMLGTSIAGGIFLAVQRFSASPAIEDPWINFGAKAVAKGMAGVEGAAAGAGISLLSSLAVSMAVLHWKDLLRFTNRDNTLIRRS